jgi:hypothetical protein
MKSARERDFVTLTACLDAGAELDGDACVHPLTQFAI